MPQHELEALVRLKLTGKIYEVVSVDALGLLTISDGMTRITTRDDDVIAVARDPRMDDGVGLPGAAV